MFDYLNEDTLSEFMWSDFSFVKFPKVTFKDFNSRVLKFKIPTIQKLAAYLISSNQIGNSNKDKNSYTGQKGKMAHQFCLDLKRKQTTVLL